MPLKDKEKQKQYMREYRRTRMTKTQKRAAVVRVDARRKELQQKYQNYKRTCKCVRCGEDDMCCLEFHHRTPGAKDFLLSQASTRGFSWEHIMEEIAKCDCLCANCHRKKHAGRW